MYLVFGWTYDPAYLSKKHLLYYLGVLDNYMPLLGIDFNNDLF